MFMNEVTDYDSNDRATHTRNAAVPLVAPKPGYAAPIAALSIPQPSPSPDTTRFPPGIHPKRMQLDQYGAPHMQPAAVTRPRPPQAAPISVPSTPHPLPPTMTPILPVFARPSVATQPHNLKWGPETIIRGNSEEKLLPKRGEQGDDFWRRFSMVIREENNKPSSQKQRFDYPCPFVTPLSISNYQFFSARGFAKPRAVRIVCPYGFGSLASSFSLQVLFNISLL